MRASSAGSAASGAASFANAAAVQATASAATTTAIAAASARRARVSHRASARSGTISVAITSGVSGPMCFMRIVPVLSMMNVSGTP